MRLFLALLVLVATTVVALPTKDELCHVPSTTQTPGTSEGPTTERTNVPVSSTSISPTTSEPITTTVPPTTTGPLSTIDPVRPCLSTPLQDPRVDCEKAGENLELVALDFGTYYYDSRATTWCEAYSLCLEHNLVLAHTLNLTMVEKLRETYSHVQHAWAGLQNMDQQPGDWRWLDGTKVDESLWYEVADGECGSLCLQNVVHSYPCESNGPGFLCQVPKFCV